MLGLKASVVVSPVGTIEEVLNRPYGTDAGGDDSPSTEVLGYCHGRRGDPTARETESSRDAKNPKSVISNLKSENWVAAKGRAVPVLQSATGGFVSALRAYPFL